MKTLIIADIRGHVTNGRIAGHIIPVARNYQMTLSSVARIKIAAGPAILNSFKQEECIILPYNVCSESIKDRFKTFINFIVLLFKSKGNTIILQQSSVVTSLVSIALFYWWTSPLYLIQYNTNAVKSTFKRIINLLAKWKITGTLCPSERIGQAYGTKYCVVPDYFYNKPIDILPLEERKWDIGIIGSITANKGVVEAATFLAKSGKKVLIAGRIMEPELEIPLQKAVQKCDNIDLKLGFVSDSDYINYIKYSKYCILNYKGTYFDRSSGVVLDALYNGTPVIGTRCEALKSIENNRLGVVYDDISVLNLDKLLEDDTCQSFLTSLGIFLESQLECRNKLFSFLNLV